MDADWTVTATPVRSRVARQQGQGNDALDLGTAESITTGRLTRSRVTRTSSSTSISATKSPGKTKAPAAKQPTWAQENVATVIVACVLGVLCVILTLLGVYGYLRYRNDQAKLAMENEEVEAGRLAIDEKKRALSAENGDGTYPHFGTSHAPLKQASSLDEQAPDYRTDESVSHSLDDIPEEMEDNYERKRSDTLGYSINEDEEEDLRHSQTHNRRSSSRQARSEESQKDLPMHPDQHTNPEGRQNPHPSPASGISNLSRSAPRDKDPRFKRPELIHMGDDQPGSVDIAGRDSVYSLEDRTKYA